MTAWGAVCASREAKPTKVNRRGKEPMVVPGGRERKPFLGMTIFVGRATKNC